MISSQSSWMPVTSTVPKEEHWVQSYLTSSDLDEGSLKLEATGRNLRATVLTITRMLFA